MIEKKIKEDITGKGETQVKSHRGEESPACSRTCKRDSLEQGYSCILNSSRKYSEGSGQGRMWMLS